jgi:hypothetical protein
MIEKRKVFRQRRGACTDTATELEAAADTCQGPGDNRAADSDCTNSARETSSCNPRLDVTDKRVYRELTT